MLIGDILSEEDKKENRPPFSEIDKILKVAFKVISVGEKYVDYGCNKCDGGKIKIDSDSYPGYTTKDCTCVDFSKQVNKTLFNLYSINTKELEKYNYNNYNEDKITKEQLYNKLYNNKHWLYLFGTPGVGKTYSSYLILFMASITKTVFTDSLNKVLEDARPSNKDNQGNLYKKCERAEVLLLDDFGTETITKWAGEKLFTLLNDRDKKNLKTLFTSNFSLEELIALDNPALKSRFYGNSERINIGGEDLRTKNII